LESPKSHRRAFLTGRAAADALAGVLNRIGGAAPELPPAVSRPRPTQLMRVSRRAMACDFEMLFNAARLRHGTPMAVGALDLVDELEDQLSVYRDTSEVSRLNQTAHQGPVTVEAGMFDLIELSLRLHHETQGAFDITSGPLSKAWGFSRRAGGIPRPEDLAAALDCVGSQHVRIDREQLTVEFLRPGVELNFGAIGKGYALDRVAQHLAARDIGEFLFHGGRSSVLGRGALDQIGTPAVDVPWTVGIGDPIRPGKRLGQLVLRDRGLSTSGSGTQFFRHEGKRYGHILDPRTGQPVQGMLSVTVTAPTAAVADALSTAFYVLGIEGSRRYCEEHPEIGAVLVHQGQDGPPKVEVLGIADDEILVAQGGELGDTDS